jgi:hypothetical protein
VQPEPQQSESQQKGQIEAQVIETSKSNNQQTDNMPPNPVPGSKAARIREDWQQNGVKPGLPGQGNIDPKKDVYEYPLSSQREQHEQGVKVAATELSPGMLSGKDLRPAEMSGEAKEIYEQLLKGMEGQQVSHNEPFKAERSITIAGNNGAYRIDAEVNPETGQPTGRYKAYREMTDINTGKHYIEEVKVNQNALRDILNPDSNFAYKDNVTGTLHYATGTGMATATSQPEPAH